MELGKIEDSADQIKLLGLFYSFQLINCHFMILFKISGSKLNSKGQNKQKSSKEGFCLTSIFYPEKLEDFANQLWRQTSLLAIPNSIRIHSTKLQF